MMGEPGYRGERLAGAGAASWEAGAMGSAVVQFEIGGPDDQLLAGFYGALFGWELTPIPGANYALIAAGGPGIGGGLGRSRTGEPWAAFYAEADDPQAVPDRAAALGGNTVVPVTQIPGKLSYAMLADPDGLLVGVARRAGIAVPAGRARPGEPVPRWSGSRSAGLMPARPAGSTPHCSAGTWRRRPGGTAW